MHSFKLPLEHSAFFSRNQPPLMRSLRCLLTSYASAFLTSSFESFLSFLSFFGFFPAFFSSFFVSSFCLYSFFSFPAFAGFVFAAAIVLLLPLSSFLPLLSSFAYLPLQSLPLAHLKPLPRFAVAARRGRMGFREHTYSLSCTQAALQS